MRPYDQSAITSRSTSTITTGRRIVHHLPIAHFHPPRRGARHFVAVRDDDQRGQPLGGDLLQQSHHRSGGL